MNKKLIVIAAIAGLGLIGGIVAYTGNKSDNVATNTSATPAMSGASDAATGRPAEAQAAGDTQNPKVTNQAGTYITLDDYNANKSKYADTKQIYFFHASWCPACRAIEKDIQSDMSQLPENVTLIKVDYDSQTSLRRQYGVTIQHTFVRINNDGTQQSKWVATSLDQVIAGIK